MSKFAWAASWSDTVKAARRNRQLLRPNHALRTEYRYNTLNQVVQQVSPDGGLTQHWYDRLGRLAVSQNAKQRAAGSPNDQDKLYSYTNYDHLGRITEVGQMKNTSANGAMSDALSRNADLLNNWLLNLTNRREQVTQTIYDQAYPGFVGSPVPATVIAQRNLRNRVSYVSCTDNHLTSTFNQATFYTYDILGNVDTLLQDYGCDNCGTQATYNMMNRNGNRRKKITYQYDLVSGKVNMMLYQNGWNDMWLHRYSYDAENRLVLVETSNDSLVWEKEARYEYYRHGPLARTVLGEQLVQGIDYAYTLQGWLKGVNSTGATATHDMGGDGRTGSLNLYTARDALGFNLNYFHGDFQPINAGVSPFPAYRLGGAGLPDSMYRPLYNGNISSMATYIKRFQGAEVGLLNVYKYDQLNRLTRQDIYKNFNPTTNSYASLQPSVKFRERVSYDANGNILTYQRNGDADIDAMMDDLTYKYYANSNRLRSIDDKVDSNRFGANSWDVIVDIDKQPDTNYVYDEIGNIVLDKKEKITSIKWNVYGKITEITRNALATDKNKTTRVRYTYDASGNRISKVEEKAGTTSKDYTWYARDAQGNILATYRASGSYGIGGLDSLNVGMSEQMIYGSSRLGMYGMGASLKDGPITRQFYDRTFFDRGRRQYELSNHLGNVLTTISDKKFGVSSGAIGSLIDYYEPDIVSANDYYPFGMVSRVGQTTTGVEYRFGFNGQEWDKEVKGWQNQLDFGARTYDPRISRFLSTDPLMYDAPEVTPYAYADNSPILFIDKYGEKPDPGFTIRNRAGNVKISKPLTRGMSKADVINKVEGRINEIKPPTPKDTRTGKIVRVARWIRSLANAASMAVTILTYDTEGKPLYETLGRQMYSEYTAGKDFIDKERLKLENNYEIITDDPEGLPDWYLQEVKKRITDGTASANDWKYKKELAKRGMVDKAVEESIMAVEVEGKSLPIYRGGENFDLKKDEYQIKPNAKIKVRGLSLTGDKAKAEGYGGAYRILHIPEELQIIFTPSSKDPLHHDIIPKDSTMTVERYQELLKQIVTERIN